MNRAALGTLALLSFLATDVHASTDRSEFTLHPAESQIALLPGEHAVVTLYAEAASNTDKEAAGGRVRKLPEGGSTLSKRRSVIRWPP